MNRSEFIQHCTNLGFVGEYNSHDSSHSHVFSTPKYIIEYEKAGVRGKHWAVYRRDEDSYCLSESLSEAVEDLRDRLVREANRLPLRDSGHIWLDEYVSMSYVRDGAAVTLSEGNVSTRVYGAGDWSEEQIAAFGLAWHLHR